jgi:hypothetical protein
VMLARPWCDPAFQPLWPPPRPTVQLAPTLSRHLSLTVGHRGLDWHTTGAGVGQASPNRGLQRQIEARHYRIKASHCQIELRRPKWGQAPRA